MASHCHLGDEWFKNSSDVIDAIPSNSQYGQIRIANAQSGLSATSPPAPYTPPKPQDTITHTLALLKPDDLFPAWQYIDLMEQQGEIDPEEARQWKEETYGLMQLWGLEADDLLSPPH